MTLLSARHKFRQISIDALAVLVWAAYFALFAMCLILPGIVFGAVLFLERVM